MGRKAFLGGPIDHISVGRSNYHLAVVMPSPDSPVAQRRPTTLVIVDDEPLVRSALADAFRKNGLELLGEATSSREAIDLVVDLRPDIVLMGLNAGETSGVETIARLDLLAPSSRILVLTRTDHNLVVEAIVAGATGYILKTASTPSIIAAIHATAAGESVISSEIAGKLLDRIRLYDIPTTASNDAAGLIRAALTTRELEIFTLLASGQSNQDIGQQLMVSTSTVSNHVASILAKLHLENRIQAAVEAVRSGIS